MRVLLLMLVVAGCGSDPPVAKPMATLSPPAEFLVCPPAPPAVPIPPKPRGFDAVIAFGQKTDARREETVRALEVCRKSLDGLIRWAQER